MTKITVAFLEMLLYNQQKGEKDGAKAHFDKIILFFALLSYLTRNKAAFLRYFFAFAKPSP